MARSSWGELPELVSWLERTLAKFDMVGALNYPFSFFFFSLFSSPFGREADCWSFGRR